MWIETLSNGKLRAVERYTDPITEKQRKVSVMIEKDTAQQRKKAAAALQIKIQEKTHVNIEKYNITFSELLERYMEHKKDCIKPSTFHLDSQKKDRLLSSIPGSVLVKNLTAAYVKDSIKSLDITSRQKNITLSFFKTVIRWAYSNDFVEDIRFIDKITPFVVKKETVIKDMEGDGLEKKLYLESDELKLLISKFKMQYAADLCTVLAMTGMRIGEAIALEYSDVDLDNRIISITKSYGLLINETLTPKTKDSVREIYIQDELLPIMKRLKKESLQNYILNKCSLLFRNEKGGRVTYSVFYHSMKLCGKKLGWNVHPHILRHTHTALLAENGMTLDEISRRLGHRDSDITKEVYFHVTQNLKNMENKKMNMVTIL